MPCPEPPCLPFAASRGAPLLAAPIRGRTLLAGIGGACLLLAGGCASDSGFVDPIRELSSAFERHSEATFVELVDANCSDRSVGDRTVGSLMATESGFRELTLRLYRGEISNDEYSNQVLLAHPAPDGNVPATGCVVDQLARCLSGRCTVETPAERQAEEAAAEADADAVRIDPTTLPPEDQAEVERLIERAQPEAPEPLP